MSDLMQALIDSVERTYGTAAAGRLQASAAPAVAAEAWAPPVPTLRQQETADDYRDHNGLTADAVVINTDHVTRELLAWCEVNGASNLRPGVVLEVLARLGVPVEQAEDEASGYTERDTGAFIGSRRPRWVGPWEEA